MIYENQGSGQKPTDYLWLGQTLIATRSDIAGNRAPELAPIGDHSVLEGALLEILLTASDPDGDGLAFSVMNEPPAATLTDHGDGSAHFHWTPALGQIGETPVVFRVTDDGVPPASDEETVTLTVVLRGDIDGDGDIDFVDFLALRRTLGNCEGDPAFNHLADYNGDGCVTRRDYRIWVMIYRSQ